MLRLRSFKIILFLIIFHTSNTAIAYIGYSISHWGPEKIQDFSKNEVNELNIENCSVTSYRSNHPRLPKRESSNNLPDKEDEIIFARGEFAKKGQKDLVVLCKPLDGGGNFLQVVWGGLAKCESKIMMRSASRFTKDPESYPGISYLKGRQPSESLQLQDALIKEFKQYKEVWKSDGLTAKQWVLESSKAPILKHDSIWFDGASRFSFYCHGNKWIRLYDALQDGEP